MKKLNKIMMLFLIAILSFFIYYLYQYRELRIQVNTIENSNIGNYYDEYMVLNDNVFDIESFKSYISNDKIFYKKINFNNICFGENENFIGFYHKGYDKSDDNLESTYNPFKINFWESIFQKGDILLNLERSKRFNENNIYAYIDGTFKQYKKFNKKKLSQFYSNELKCDKTTFANVLNLKSKKIRIKLVKDEFKILFNEHENTSTSIIIKYLMQNFTNTNSELLFFNIDFFDFEDIKCEDR